MAQENAQVSPINQKVILHEAIIEGKIAEIEQPDNSEFIYYEFSLPSRDEYSMPAVIQVSQSNKQRPFGRVGDLIRIRVALGGFPRRSGGRKYVTNTLQYLETL